MCFRSFFPCCRVPYLIQNFHQKSVPELLTKSVILLQNLLKMSLRLLFLLPAISARVAQYGDSVIIDGDDDDYLGVEPYHDNERVGSMYRYINEKYGHLELPEYVDWREKGVVTPVKDQVACPTCWAFATAAAIESQVAIQYGILEDLSPQILVDCAHPEQDVLVNGGTDTIAMDALSRWDYQIPNLYNYPYYLDCHHGETGKFRYIDPKTEKQYCPRDVGLGSSINVKKNYRFSILSTASAGDHKKFADTLMRALAFHGTAYITVNEHEALDYRPGSAPVSCSKKVDIGHAVQLVGYGVENGIPYWLIKQSHSPWMFDKGYIKIARSTTDEDFETKNDCGIIRTGAIFEVERNFVATPVFPKTADTPDHKFLHINQ